MSFGGKSPLGDFSKIQINEIAPDGNDRTNLAIQKERISNLAAAGASTNYEMIKTERTGANNCVALITLNRPKALNALCKQLMDELADSLQNLDNDSSVGAVVITGSEKAFAGNLNYLDAQINFFIFQLVPT